MDKQHSAFLITELDTSELSGLGSCHRTPVQIRQEVRWAPASRWTQWSGLWSSHSFPLQSHGKVGGGHQHQYEHSGHIYGLTTVSHYQSDRHRHQYEHAGQAYGLATVLQYKSDSRSDWHQHQHDHTYSLSTVSQKQWEEVRRHQHQYDDSGYIYGLITIPQHSYNMKTVVRFMVWPQYPSNN